MAICLFIFSGVKDFFGDEFGISRDLGINQWILPIVMMLIGIVISMFVVFKIIPKKIRLIFIASGLVGGMLGFFIWFYFLGQLIFPLPISF